MFAAIIGAPIAAAAYGFLWLVDEAQDWLYRDLPDELGFDGEPAWWPLPLLALAGLLVGLTIRYLPGHGGESPADGFESGRAAPAPVELPGIFCAALAGLALGVVLGPEAPLIALGPGSAPARCGSPRGMSRHGQRRWPALPGASPPSARCWARPCSRRSC